MCKKFFMKILLVALFISVPLAGVTSASNSNDLLFEGEFHCDLDGLYYLGPIAYPLNVLGLLEVSEAGLILGDLSINAQKTSIHEDWDGTYIGHWVFTTEGSEPSYDMGIISSLGCADGVVSFILNGFPDLLGLEGEQAEVSGSMDDNMFSGTMVPIPGTLLLFGSGLLGLICIRRK